MSGDAVETRRSRGSAERVPPRERPPHNDSGLGQPRPKPLNGHDSSLSSVVKRRPMSMQETSSITGRRMGRTYPHPVGFWMGVILTTTGVLLQVPMYLMASGDHYMLAGMPLDTPMQIGLILIALGIGVTVWALWPKKPVSRADLGKIKIGALDDTPLKRAHVALLLVMAVPITIDVMKSV